MQTAEIRRIHPPSKPGVIDRCWFLVQLHFCEENEQESILSA
jgi:hypothetical protein